jgi:hypothetical protein
MVDYKVKINYKHLGGDIMDSKEVKKQLYSLGADLCGIASVDRLF